MDNIERVNKIRFYNVLYYLISLKKRGINMFSEVYYSSRFLSVSNKLSVK